MNEYCKHMLYNRMFVFVLILENESRIKSKKQSGL
jgi:hypothetical protein